MNKPVIHLIGGANGAGKTTLAEQLTAAHQIPYLGADLIAEELNPSDVAAVQIAAGREFFKRLKQFLADRESLIVESTLSGKSLVRHINAFKQAGFYVRMSYVF